MSSTDLDILQRRFDRERQARKEAEAALEQESLKLYHANEKLKLVNQRLEEEVVEQVTARQQSEARAASIVDTALDAVLAIDAAGGIISWNKQAQTIFGWSADEAIGRTLADLIVPPRGPDVPAAELARVIATSLADPASRRVEATAIDRAGREFPVELAISPLQSQSGVTLSAFIRDISARKQSEQRSAALYQVARILAEAVTVEDARPQILQAICQSMQWDVGISWDIDPAYGALCHRADWLASPERAFLTTPSREMRFQSGIGLPGRVWATGSPAWLTDLSVDDNFPRRAAAIAAGLRSGFGFPVKIGATVIGVMEFFCGQIRQPDNDLLAVFDALGSQIGQFVQRRRAETEAEAARKHAELASAAKSEFLAKMSHEIRTPLNGVAGMVELLGGTNLDEQQRRFLQITKSSADSLLAIINDILDFSKIEAGRMELEFVEFEPRRIVEDAIDSFSSAAAKKGLELGSVIDPDLPSRGVGDPGRFRQILTNLIGNAIKFTPGGRVLVRLKRGDSAEAGKLTIRAEVDDTGIGVPADKLDRLFKSFSQADASTTRTYGGTGLGLAISKRLAQLMGGEIGVHPNPTDGSTFWFTVTLGAGDSPALSSDCSWERMRNLRILAVDDNPAALEVMGAMLSRWTSQVRTTQTAAAAVADLRAAAAAGETVDVVLLDIRMPDMDGWSLVNTIRGDPALRGARVIAIGGIDERMDRYRLVAGGFDAGLTKPLKQSRLFDSIVSAVSGSHPGVEDQPADRKAGADERAPAGARVLVAEDNEVNQFVIRKMLISRGYECDIVNNGRQAVELARRGRYDLLLMDCSMPEMDGFEATRQIRDHEATDPGRPHLPIIALTAEAMNGDREKCRAVGMDEYVAKPIDPAVLFGTMRQFIKQSKAQQHTPGIVNAINALMADAPALVPDGEPKLINFDALLDRSLGDFEFARETLDRFRHRVEEDLTALYRDLGTGSFGEVSRTAHGLKGVAGHVGAQSLRDIAGRIESLGRTADTEQLEQCLETLRSEISKTTAYIPIALAQATQAEAARTK